MDPAIQMVSEAEAHALQVAVQYALREGLATDDYDTEPSNRSLVSVARKLGLEIPEGQI